MKTNDPRMGWPTEINEPTKEVRLDMSFVMLDVSKSSAYSAGYEAQKTGVALKAAPYTDPVKKRQWTMGWGAGFADNGPRAFATGGIVSDFPERYRYMNGGMGMNNGIPMPPQLSDAYCIIAPYPGRNWSDTIDRAVKHGEKLMNKQSRYGHQNKTLLVAKAVRVIEREEEPRPPLRVRMPRPGEFA